MKKTFIALALCALIMGCGDATDTLKCYRNVQKAFPGAEITQYPGKVYRFLVRTPSGDVYIAETLLWNSPGVSKKVLVFGDRNNDP